MNFLCILGEGKGGGALMHVYIWEHMLRLFYRTNQWMFTKLGREGVLTALHVFRLFYQIDPGWGKKRSMRGPFSKGLFLQIGM